MGYNFMPMAVDLKKVEAAVGSKDKRLFDTLSTKFAKKIASTDDIYKHQTGIPSAATALRHLIYGEQRVEDNFAGGVYAYVLEMLYLHLGELLDNSAWSALPSGAEWRETFQQALSVTVHLLQTGAAARGGAC
jgi:hypothetical protein